jgi:cytochrome c-type biogenesis protein CcmH
LLPPESDDARELRSQIVQAGGVAPEPAGPLAAALAPRAAAPAAAPAAATAAATAAPAAAAVPGASVTGRLDIAPGLAAAPTDVVFIIARAPGQRIPAAVIRTTVAQLPRDFKLDDSLAMSPQARISMLRDVQVEARVSKSGDPAAQPGDLVSEPQTVAVGATGVALRISRVKGP